MPDDLTSAIRRAARAMSTADLQCMYQEGRSLGGVWPSVIAALADVLAERGEHPINQET